MVERLLKALRAAPGELAAVLRSGASAPALGTEKQWRSGVVYRQRFRIVVITAPRDDR
jgi:hypothetical protein